VRGRRVGRLIIREGMVREEGGGEEERNKGGGREEEGSESRERELVKVKRSKVRKGGYEEKSIEMGIKGRGNGRGRWRSKKVKKVVEGGGGGIRVRRGGE
jgi:hypothetical protein